MERPSNRDWSDCDPTFAAEANAAIRALRDTGAGADARARRLAARLVERYPGSPLAHTILAEGHRVRGRLEGARSSLERAAALAPGCPRTAFMLAAVLTRMGLFDEAMEVCDRSLRVPQPTDRRATSPTRGNASSPRTRSIGSLIPDKGSVGCVSGPRSAGEPRFHFHRSPRCPRRTGRRKAPRPTSRWLAISGAA